MLQPESHNTLIDTKDVCASSGTICDYFASDGSHGMSSWHVWIWFVWSPSGRFMVSGLVAILMFFSGVPGRKTFPVDPASAISWYISMLVFDLLNIVSFCGDWDRGCSLMIFFHAPVSCPRFLLFIIIIISSSSSASGRYVCILFVKFEVGVDA